MVFVDCLIIGGVDGTALLPGLPDVPFGTLSRSLWNSQSSPTLSNLDLCSWDIIFVLFWHHPMELGEAGTIACTPWCVRWDTAGLEELLVLGNVTKGSGDGGESSEGLQVVPAQSHSLSLLCLVSVLHLHKEH